MKPGMNVAIDIRNDDAVEAAKTWLTECRSRQDRTAR
jgi:hypothetical protein